MRIGDPYCHAHGSFGRGLNHLQYHLDRREWPEDWPEDVCLDTSCGHWERNEGLYEPHRGVECGSVIKWVRSFLDFFRQMVRTVEVNTGYHATDIDWYVVTVDERRIRVTVDQAFFVMKEVLEWSVTRGDDGSITVHRGGN